MCLTKKKSQGYKTTNDVTVYEEVNEDNRRGTKLEQKKIESANTKEYRK